MSKLHLIPVVLGAAVAVGAYVVGKYLTKDEEDEEIVDETAFDDGESAPEAAGESAEAAETTEEAPEEAPAEPEAPAADEIPVVQEAAAQAPAEPISIPIEDGDAPAPNPVKDETEPAAAGEDGKLDPTTIAKAEDFAGWDETGCQG